MTPRRKRLLLWLGAELGFRILLIIAWVAVTFIKPPHLGLDVGKLSEYAYPFEPETLSAAMVVVVYVVTIVLLVLFSWSTIYYLTGQSWLYIGWETIFLLLGLSTSMLLSVLSTELLKRTIGAHRPDYISRCTGFTSYADLAKFVQTVTDNSPLECTTPADDKNLIHGRMSFPSGHTSSSFSCYVFVVLYMWHRLRDHTTLGSVRIMLPFLLIFPPAIIAVSRLWDHRHHPRDLIGGLILGTVCGILGYAAYFTKTSLATSRSLLMYGASPTVPADVTPTHAISQNYNRAKSPPKVSPDDLP